MESEEGRRVIASLAIRISHLGNIDEIADVVIMLLRDTNASLVPIIGPRGASALYRRSLIQCMSLHPRLADTYHSLKDPLDLAELKSTLIQQEQNDVIFFGEELLTALYELLVMLIGSSLSRRLLLDVWDISLSIPPSQETSL